MMRGHLWSKLRRIVSVSLYEATRWSSDVDSVWEADKQTNKQIDERTSGKQESKFADKRMNANKSFISFLLCIPIKFSQFWAQFKFKISSLRMITMQWMARVPFNWIATSFCLVRSSKATARKELDQVKRPRQDLIFLFSKFDLLWEKQQQGARSSSNWRSK